MNKFTIGLNIRIGRVKKGLSRDELGRIVGVDQQTIFIWETCKEIPDRNMIKRLSELFGEDLLDSRIC